MNLAWLISGRQNTARAWPWANRGPSKRDSGWPHRPRITLSRVCKRSGAQFPAAEKRSPARRTGEPSLVVAGRGFGGNPCSASAKGSRARVPLLHAHRRPHQGVEQLLGDHLARNGLRNGNHRSQVEVFGRAANVTLGGAVPSSVGRRGYSDRAAASATSPRRSRSVPL